MEVCGGSRSTQTSFARPGLDVWVWSQSQDRARIDGADVHFLSSCASGRITRMLLADICGHGPVFAELASELRNLMVRNVNTIKQAEFIRQMNDRLRASADRGGFATALISTFFSPAKTFTMCNAGHPSPLVYRARAGGWSVLRQSTPAAAETGDTPLGVVDRDEYQQFSTRLENGDMVLSFSNVLAECRDGDRRTLGIDGLLEQVAQTDSTVPSELLAALVNRLSCWNSNQLAEQDATLLLCRATDRTVGWKDNLLAPLRLLRNVEDNTQLELQ